MRHIAGDGGDVGGCSRDIFIEEDRSVVRCDGVEMI